jgi:hypothetical protein
MDVDPSMGSFAGLVFGPVEDLGSSISMAIQSKIDHKPTSIQ